MTEFKLGSKRIGDGHPVYFIAEIGANHCNDLAHTKRLIELAKEAGADCAKFQHYRADTLASHYGFEQLASLAHYTANPYDVFKKYQIPWEWTPILKEYCDEVGIEFMSTPYDLEAVDHLDPYVNAYKIGSGDITYRELVERVGSKGKPVLLSIGASGWGECLKSISWLPVMLPVVVLQCNTNYTSSMYNFEVNESFSNLKVIEKFADMVEEGYTLTGLSDHTMVTSIPVLAAVTLGAKVIEKHFGMVDCSSPDSTFDLHPGEFEHMVKQVRRLERALGDGVKKVEDNERETVVLQRRCMRATRDLYAGSKLVEADMAPLRPAPEGSVTPSLADELVGKALRRDVVAGEHFRLEDL